MNETKAYYKSHGICIDCGQYDAAPGKNTCEVCAAKHTEREMKRYRSMPVEIKSEYLKKHAESCRKRYYDRKNSGLCTRCGKPQAADSGRLCVSCRIKERRAKEKRTRKSIIPRTELYAYGICYLCCKEPILEGRRLCAKCYEKSVKSMEIARNSKRGKEAREYFREIEHIDFLLRTTARSSGTDKRAREYFRQNEHMNLVKQTRKENINEPR